MSETAVQTWRFAEAATIERVQMELVAARRKFPNNQHMLAALLEEVGEVARGLLEGDWENVRDEAVQVAAVAIRILEEGDADFPGSSAVSS